MEKDFETFYQTRIQPSLGGLKLQKDEAAKWKVAGIAFVLFAVCAFALGQPYMGILFILIVIVSIYKYTKNKDSFIDKYKETIINEVINFIHPGFIYKPNNYVSSKEYKASGLYRYIYKNYDGDDYIQGNYKGVNFHCSEIETAYDTHQEMPIRSMQNGGSLTIFKGLFFVAVINNFRGGTYIWTKGEEQLAVSIADEQYRMFPLPHVYRLKVADKEFNEYFSAYSSYPAEANILLTQEMTRLIVNFRKQIGRDIRLSAVAGKFYVSIPLEEDLLEPSGDLDDKETVKEYFFSILLILSIINQLQLNRFT